MTVSEFVPGPLPERESDFARLREQLERLHSVTKTYRQRPGFVSSGGLLKRIKGGDVNLEDMARADVVLIRSALRAVQHGPRSVVHGDPGAGNVLLDRDVSLLLLDWDEAWVDVGWLDLSAIPQGLPVPLPGGFSREVVVRAGVAWEAATCWQTEPEYARRRLAELKLTGTLSSAP